MEVVDCIGTLEVTLVLTKVVSVNAVRTANQRMVVNNDTLRPQVADSGQKALQIYSLHEANCFQPFTGALVSNIAYTIKKGCSGGTGLGKTKFFETFFENPLETRTY
jgi:hypothetical protein